jgi:hypothetical protein
MFQYNPNPFDYFRYSFHRERPALYHYYIYHFCIISTSLFLTLLPQLSWLPLLPFFLLLAYTIGYRPFK